MSWELVRRSFAGSFEPSEIFDFVYGDLWSTAVFNASSLFVTLGEGFLVRVVRLALERSPDGSTQLRLAEEYRKLMEQEIEHSRVHSRYNSMLVQQGMRSSEYARPFRELLSSQLERGSLPEAVALTVAVEEHTVLSAVAGLRHIFRYEQGTPCLPNEFLRFWYWHWQEEIEHCDSSSKLLMEMVPDSAERRLLRDDASARFHAALVRGLWDGVQLFVEGATRYLGVPLPEIPACYLKFVRDVKMLGERARSADLLSEAIPDLVSLRDAPFLDGVAAGRVHPTPA